MGLGDPNNSMPTGASAFSARSGGSAGRQVGPTAAPRRRPRAHPLAIVLTGASLVAIAVCVVQSWRTWLADNNPEAALAWGLASPAALSTVGDRRIDAPGRPGDDSEAMAYARQALLAEPLDVPALPALALQTHKPHTPSPPRTMMVLAAH